MRLSVTTYNIFKDWDLDTLCRQLPKAGVEGIEFRTSAGHKHGVEVETSARERQTIKSKLQSAGLEPVSIATGCRFHEQDAAKLRENIDGTQQALELAADLGAPRVRVFGNNTIEGENPDDTAIRAGQALRELGPIAERLGVDVLLEMHGDFNEWWLNKRAVTFANHRKVASIYNCDKRDLVDGSIAAVFHEMKALIRHIHCHDLTENLYPYPELFALLVRDGYSGFISLEVSMAGDVADNLQQQAQEFVRLRKEALAKG